MKIIPKEKAEEALSFVCKGRTHWSIIAGWYGLSREELLENFKYYQLVPQVKQEDL